MGIIEPNALALGSVAALPSIRFFIGVPGTDRDSTEAGEADALGRSLDRADIALLMSSNIPDKSLASFCGEGIGEGFDLVDLGVRWAGLESWETGIGMGVGVTDRNTWGTL
jgi:hypothetical protein